MTDTVPSLHMVDIDGSQCFPLYLCVDIDVEDDNSVTLQGALFEEPPTASRQRRDASTDEGLGHFEQAYQGETIGKEDVFYYTYPPKSSELVPSDLGLSTSNPSRSRTDTLL